MRTVVCNKVNVCITCVVLLLIYIFVDFLIIAILETLLICCDTIFVDID